MGSAKRHRCGEGSASLSGSMARSASAWRSRRFSASTPGSGPSMRAIGTHSPAAASSPSGQTRASTRVSSWPIQTFAYSACAGYAPRLSTRGASSAIASPGARAATQRSA